MDWVIRPWQPLGFGHLHKWQSLGDVKPCETMWNHVRKDKFWFCTCTDDGTTWPDHFASSLNSPLALRATMTHFWESLPKLVTCEPVVPNASITVQALQPPKCLNFHILHIKTNHFSISFQPLNTCIHMYLIYFNIIFTHLSIVFLYVYQWIFPLNMVIFPLNMVIFPLKMVIFHWKWWFSHWTWWFSIENCDFPYITNLNPQLNPWAAPHLAVATAWGASCSPERLGTRTGAAPCPCPCCPWEYRWISFVCATVL